MVSSNNPKCSGGILYQILPRDLYGPVTVIDLYEGHRFLPLVRKIEESYISFANHHDRFYFSSFPLAQFPMSLIHPRKNLHEKLCFQKKKKSILENQGKNTTVRTENEITRGHVTGDALSEENRHCMA